MDLNISSLQQQAFLLFLSYVIEYLVVKLYMML